MDTESQAHLHFLESMDKVNRAIQGADDLEQMMGDVLDVVLDIFASDRTGLVCPCDPTAATWHVPMERTRPEYPGLHGRDEAIPMTPEAREIFRAFLNASGPVSFGPGSGYSRTWASAEIYGIKSFLGMALYPKTGSPWHFVIHQCSHARAWSAEEERLFQEIGRRLEDVLSSLLIFRNLQKSETRFRTFVDHAADAFFLHDENGTILDANHQACKQLGYSRDELLGRTPMEFDVDADMREMGLGSRLNAGEVVAFESRHQRKDGTVFPVEIRVRQFMQDGKLFGVSLVRDITERKRAEAALATKDMELRNLAESSPGLMGTFHIHPDGSISMPYASPSIWDLYGLRPEDVVDDAMPLLQRRHPDDADKVKNSIAESARTMSPWHCEYRVMHPTRGVIWLEGSTTPKPHPDGGVIFYGFVHDITERKCAEDALRESRGHLSAIIHSVDGIVWEADAETFRFTFVSPRAERLLGYPSALWIDDPAFWVEHIHPEDREHAMNYCRQCVLDKRDHEFEYRMLAADGRVIWLRDIVTIVLEDGRPKKLRGIMVDITAQKQAEQRIRQLNRTYSVLSDINQLIVREREPQTMLAEACRIAVQKGSFLLAWIGLIEESSGVLRVNKYAGAATDIHQKFQPVFGGPEPDCPFARQALASSRHAICNNIANDAKTAPWRTAAAELGYESLVSLPLTVGGKQVGVFNLYAGEQDFFDAEEMRLLDELALDIAFALESYQREQERLRALEQLRASEERFRELAETIQEVFWVTDPEKNQMLYVSPAYEKVWGRSCRSLYDEPRSWLEAIHPDDRERVMEAAVLRQPLGSYNEEYRIVRPGGEVRWINDRAFTVYNKEGKVERVVGLAQDITARRQLEEEFRQAQKMEAVGRLAGGIAHDFNNLLVPIIGYIDMNLAEMEPGSKLYEDLTQVHIAADRAAELTGQILAFSRQQVLDLTILDLNAVVKEFKQMLQRLIGEDIQLLTHLSPSLYSVKADRGQLEQVLMNLVINSRDAMPEGGKFAIETVNTVLNKADIEQLGLELPPGHYVRLTTRDTGQGMDAETQKHIFEPFFTTKAKGKGTGLGLSTVFGIIKQHRGHIRVSSAPGSGTAFDIYLPGAEGAGEMKAPKAKDAGAIRGTETVLVVEDEEIVRRFVCETLTAHGYTVIEASLPSECLALASAADTPHLLLTDVIMPEMNGKELYRKLHAIHPDCSVLYMSGYTDDVIDSHGGLEQGINYLKKPFTIHNLTRKVREVLDAGKA